jgi:hypothetical protein
MNVLLPFYAVYTLPAANASDSAISTQHLNALFGDKILICTEQGFQWVDVDALEKGEAKPPLHKQLKCPVCYASAFGVKDGIVPLKPVIELRERVAVVQPFILADESFPPQWRGHSIASRAPPALPL